MGSVAALFLAPRWVASWESAGGLLAIGRGPFGPERQQLDALLDLGPPMASNAGRDQPLRQEVARLRLLLDQPNARTAVIDHLKRRLATKGRGNV